MICIRVKPLNIAARFRYVTIRIDGGKKQRCTSAIHALHIVWVAVVEQGMRIEQTVKTRSAIDACITRARIELEAAVKDIADRVP